MAYLFDPATRPSLPIQGSTFLYPVHRAFCVGRNYEAHAKEMGVEVDREAPFYFLKSAHHIGLAQGTTPIPPETRNYHHEIELVVALKSGGANISRQKAMDHVFGYAVGLDMTRRDLQSAAKTKGRPWDTGKDAEQSGLVSVIRPLDQSMSHDKGLIELKVNDQVRQSADMSQHVWSLPEIIANLSKLYTLEAGDLIFMGTPAGVGPVQVGDTLKGSITNIGNFTVKFE